MTLGMGPVESWDTRSAFGGSLESACQWKGEKGTAGRMLSYSFITAVHVVVFFVRALGSFIFNSVPRT